MKALQHTLVLLCFALCAGRVRQQPGRYARRRVLGRIERLQRLGERDLGGAGQDPSSGTGTVKLTLRAK